jgi:sulfur-oxidizing protein SoxX
MPGIGAMVAAHALAAVLLAAAPAAALAQSAPPPAAFEVVGDAVPVPLAGLQGDAARGRRIVLDRALGNCLICHRAPEPAERQMGDLGPDLAGIGARLSVGQIRLRLVDQARLNPGTIMPPYHRVTGLTRVAGRYRGLPVLDAGQVEDVVAYLASLRN